MDQYGQIGPEKGEYAADVRAVARALTADRTTLFVALADRMTKYHLMITRAQDFVSLGGWPEHLPQDGELRIEPLRDWIYLSHQGKGAAWLNIASYLSPDFIAENLGVTLGDGEVLGEFLTRLHAELCPPLRAA